MKVDVAAQGRNETQILMNITEYDILLSYVHQLFRESKFEANVR